MIGSVWNFLDLIVLHVGFLRVLRNWCLLQLSNKLLKTCWQRLRIAALLQMKRAHHQRYVRSSGTLAGELQQKQSQVAKSAASYVQNRALGSSSSSEQVRRHLAGTPLLLDLASGQAGSEWPV